MKKALLTLFGGRSFLPTALLLIHEKPDLIVAISSKQSHGNLPQLQKAIEKFQMDFEFKTVLETPEALDAFDVTKIQKVCEEVLIQHPHFEWIFDITGGTALMSIGAYETARKFSKEHNHTISCWYLNTAQTRVISLVGKECNKDIFHISVDAYVTAYNHTVKPGELEGIQDGDQKSWLSFAGKVGKSVESMRLLEKVKDGIKSGSNARPYRLPGLSDETYGFLEEAQQAGLVSQLQRDTDGSICFKLSHLQHTFLDGVWLEAYVWDEARNLWDETRQTHLFDDCQWKQTTEGDNHNELDVMMTYKAQLIVVECKTGDNDKNGAFAPGTLYKWDSVSSSFGGKFVGKLLITSLEPPDEVGTDKFNNHQDFLAKARSKGIVIVTREELPDIGAILKREAETPTYSRI